MLLCDFEDSIHRKNRVLITLLKVIGVQSIFRTVNAMLHSNIYKINV